MISRILTFLRSLYPKKRNVRSYKVGQLYQVRDSDWDDNFARNRRHLGGKHPGLLREKNPDSFTFKVVPGTTKNYEKKCLFKTKLVKDKQSYFLLKKITSMTTEQLDGYGGGWSNVEQLNDEQMHNFRMDFRNCFGRELNEN